MGQHECLILTKESQDMSIKIPQTKKDHLEFYLENEISPVRQNIDDLEKHFQRRASLYQKLGISSLLFEKKNILEVGPGSGHNSLYVASCHPETYDLLEPNKTAQNDIKSLYSQINIELTKPNLIEKKLEDFLPDKQYDIVICEAWLGVSDHERAMMKKLGSLVRRKGILLTTIASPLASLPNGIRRILSWKMINQKDTIHQKTKILVDAYSSHLDTLKDMSRIYEDWVQDSLINPAFFTMCPQPDMFIDDMGSEFEVYDSFPRFEKDWRWYKTLYRNNKKFNEKFLEAYHRNIHNFFDYNGVLPEIDEKTGALLEKEAFHFMNQVAINEETGKTAIDDEIIDCVKTIRALMIKMNPCLSDPLDEAIELMESNIVSTEQVAQMTHFNKIFGRELIYVSAVKN